MKNGKKSGMDKPIEVEFKKLLGELHKSVFKAQGYKKTGSNFRLYLPNGLCKIVNFQKSQFNDGGECRFTINIGLYFQKNPEQPYLMFKEYECQVRTRAAGVSPKYVGDKWWSITEDAKTDQLYSELYALLSEDVLPWLDQFSCRQDTIRAGQAGKLKNMIRGSLYVNI